MAIFPPRRPTIPHGPGAMPKWRQRVLRPPRVRRRFSRALWPHTRSDETMAERTLCAFAQGPLRSRRPQGRKFPAGKAPAHADDGVVPGHVVAAERAEQMARDQRERATARLARDERERPL